MQTGFIDLDSPKLGRGGCNSIFISTVGSYENKPLKISYYGIDLKLVCLSLCGSTVSAGSGSCRPVNFPVKMSEKRIVSVTNFRT